MTRRGAVRSQWRARGQASGGTRYEIRTTGEMRAKDQALCRHSRPQQVKAEDNSQTKQTSETYISNNIRSPGHPVKQVSNVAGGGTMATVFERGSHPTGNEHDGTMVIGEGTLWGQGVTNPVSRSGLGHFPPVSPEKSLYICVLKTYVNRGLP